MTNKDGERQNKKEVHGNRKVLKKKQLRDQDEVSDRESKREREREQSARERERERGGEGERDEEWMPKSGMM